MEAVRLAVDSNPGTLASPKHTIAAASGGMSLLRSGKPDWLLLRKGDAWTDEGSSNPPAGNGYSGQDASNPDGVHVLSSHAGCAAQDGFAQ